MPSFTSILSVAALSACVSALSISEPTKNELWNSGKSNTITWESVSTDPQVFDIYLAHMASNPPLYSLLFPNVDASKNSVTVSGLQLPTGQTYQVNFVAHNKPEQIYAQSQQFNVTGEAVDATSTVDGYSGPTYTPSASKDGESSATKTTLSKTTSTGKSSATDASDSTGTTTTTESTSTSKPTKSTTNTSSGTGKGDSSATPTGKNSTVSSTTPSASATTTPNAAVGAYAASAPLALFLGVLAIFA